MRTPKKNQFTVGQRTVATLGKALGHPARIAIIDYLLSGKSGLEEDIGKELALGLGGVLPHLDALKSGGLVREYVEGGNVCYCIEEKAIGQLQDYFARILTKLTCK